MRTLRRFRTTILIGLLLTGSVIVGLLNQGKATEFVTWQRASQVAPASLVQQIQQENLSGNSQVGDMKVWKIQRPQQSKPLYLIDSRIKGKASLCGALGCAFWGYVPVSDRFQRVLSAYFDPRLPPKIQLFESQNALQNGLPILKVNQLEKQQICQYQYEFNGKGYELMETRLLPQRYE